MDGRLEGQEAAVVLLAPLARCDHDRLVPQLVHEPAPRVHELRRDDHPLAEHVVEPVDDGPLAAGRRRLDGPHPSQVVAEPHAEVEPAQLARRADDHAHRLALAVDRGIRLQARERGGLRRFEAGPAPLQRRTARGIAHDHLDDGAAPGPAARRELGGGDLEMGLTRREGERALDTRDESAARGAGARLDDDVSGTTGRHDSGKTGFSRRHEFAESQISLSARGPQDRARKERVFVLPVVPVRPRLHGVDGLGDEAVADRGERHDASAPVRARGDDRQPAGLDGHVAPRFVAVEAPAARAGGDEVEIEASGDRVRPCDPLAFGDRIAVGLRVAALVHAVVRDVHERRDVPDPRVALGLVAEERVALHVADERVQQHEPRALAHPPQDRVARPARVTRPAVQARDHEHLEGLRTPQLLLDVAVDDPEVVPVPAQHVVAVVEVADSPAVDVPIAVDRDGRRIEREPLHELDHVPALDDRRHEEAADRPARQLRRPGHVRRADLGAEEDVVARLRGTARRDERPRHGRDRRGPPDLPSDPHAFPEAAAARCESAAESRSR